MGPPRQQCEVHIQSPILSCLLIILLGLSESLDQEIQPLGLRCHCIEPGYFRTTNLAADRRRPYIHRIDDYSQLTKAVDEKLTAYDGRQPGDPKRFAQLLVDLVHREGLFKGRVTIPTSIPVGSDAYKGVKKVCEETLNKLEEWKDIIQWTDIPGTV